LLYSEHVEDLIKKLELNLLHAHFAYPEGWTAYLAKVGIRQHIPLVVTLHGYDILVEPSIGYGIRLNKRYDVPVKKVLNAADAIIVASKAVFNEAASLVKDVGKIHLIPNGVDTKRFNPELSGNIIRERFAIEDKQVIFALRDHRPVYGISYLLLAAKLILDKRKDAVFIIGGDGPLLDYHKMLTRRLGISSYVFFTGRIPREEVPLYYAASDVVVVPSLQEAWGLVATEAMACGKPVVASRVGGLPDQVIDGYNGFLVPPRDPRALADRILNLLENPSEARRMGLNGRRLAEERFDIEKRVDKIVKLYKEIVGGQGNAA
jgi:N-acetyl-alpha-D-glucosaminyl L-malate synthase BshA